jgi:hypothetical protein
MPKDEQHAPVQRACADENERNHIRPTDGYHKMPG